MNVSVEFVLKFIQVREVEIIHIEIRLIVHIDSPWIQQPEIFRRGSMCLFVLFLAKVLTLVENARSNGVQIIYTLYADHTSAHVKVGLDLEGACKDVSTLNISSLKKAFVSDVWFLDETATVKNQTKKRNEYNVAKEEYKDASEVTWEHSWLQ
ncbi:hypothetical protein Tco_0883388 [Tanacetum coccineum]